MKHFVAIPLCATVFFALQTAALAQTTNERPLQELFQSETVYPQEKGETQLTFSSSFSKNRDHKLFALPLGIEYGLTDKWQVSVEWAVTNRLTTDDAKTRGPGDLRVGTKYSWMNIRHSNFHVATGFDLGLPTGSVKKGIGEGEVEYEPYVIVAKDFPKLSQLQIFSQLGLAIGQTVKTAGDEDDDEDESISKTIEWNNGFFVSYRRARFTTEVNWSKSATENSLYLTPGIVWKLPRQVEFGFGVPVGLTRDADRFRTIVKLIYEFGGTKETGQ